MGEKGQIVIEKPIRDALGIQPGSIAVQSLREDHIEIRFYPAEHSRSLRGVLARGMGRSVAQQSWQQAREDAWSEAVGENAQPPKTGR